MSKRLRQAMLAVHLGMMLCAVAQGAPEAYVVDPARTHPRLSLAYIGYAVPLARFNRSSGRVVLDRAMRTASVDVFVHTDSIDTGYSAIDRLIQGEAFLDAARYPKAVFRSFRVHFVGDRPVRIDGTLTLKGVTQPVKLMVNSFRRLSPPGRKSETLAVGALATIRRSDFGLGGLVPNIGDEILVDVEIEMVRE